uniref:Uncharacterized protein n=1 Tax=Triticum urartu TaxID=4572 RepID=A0A8R7UHY0_TRIUA
MYLPRLGVQTSMDSNPPSPGRWHQGPHLSDLPSPKSPRRSSMRRGNQASRRSPSPSG